jgi:hypothetical protein
MRILFDACCPRPLRKFLPSHEIITVQQMGWEALRNGELLTRVQDEFEVMISTDSNIEYQQQLPSYDIALIVLRSVTGQVDELATLMPDCEEALQVIQSGECFYLFTDEAWARELKRGKIRQRWLPNN